MRRGVLLLHGSSGTADLERARILEAEGYDVLAPQWFDGRISEIPLESFPLDELAARNDRLVVMGLSRGAEAALLLGALDERVDAVIALSPSAYVWGWIEGEQQTSAWTWQGEALPFVPMDLTGNRGRIRRASPGGTGRACSGTAPRPKPLGSRWSGSAVRCCSQPAATIRSGRRWSSPSGSPWPARI